MYNYACLNPIADVGLNLFSADYAKVDDVKEADARSKCIEVYNTFKIVREKYLEFITKYFVYNEENNQSSIQNSSGEMVSAQEYEFDKISNIELNKINFSLNQKNSNFATLNLTLF